MKKMNNKGFTLVEVIAVVVILSTLMAIMVPSVNYLIKKNKENNYQEIQNSLIQATKTLFSDYRYEVSLDGSCGNLTDKKDILKVGNHVLTDSKVPIEILVQESNIKVDKNGNIINPLNKQQRLNLESSYVLVKYQCETKDFSYELESDSLIW